MKARPILPAGRQVTLTERRGLKMAESAHAHVRGNTIKFYEWLDAVGLSKFLPDGPPVSICGDCHIGNLGPVAIAESASNSKYQEVERIA